MTGFSPVSPVGVTRFFLSLTDDLVEKKRITNIVDGKKNTSQKVKQFFKPGVFCYPVSTKTE